MSNAVFPDLPGLKWDVVKAPAFSTRIQTAASGRELRAAVMQYPKWTYRLAYEVLRDGAAGTELDTLMGFFLARQGSFDSFLYTDPSDNTVTDQQFGAGDGITSQFQLVRAAGAGGFSFTEPVMNVNAITNIKKAGVSLTIGTDYTVGSTGIVSFSVAPAAGAALTWSGSYYFRVRFLQDMAEFSQFMKDLWELKKLEFIGAPGNKV